MKKLESNYCQHSGKRVERGTGRIFLERSNRGPRSWKEVHLVRRGYERRYKNNFH